MRAAFLMSKKSRVIVAVVSDLHIGSTVALCPPKGIELEDGGKYQPNAAQQAIWRAWQFYWAEVKRRAAGAPVVAIVNGEFIEGNHHATSQIASPSPEMMRQAALTALDPAYGIVRTWFVTKGTAAHSSAGGASDEAIARELGAERDPDTGQAAAYHWRIDINDVLFSAAHHYSGGSTPWGRGNNIRAEVLKMLLESAESGIRAPDVVLRSHTHTPVDTGKNFSTLGVGTGAWQLLTEYGHKVTRTMLRGVSGEVFELAGGAFDWQRLQFRIAELPVVKWSMNQSAATNRKRRLVPRYSPS